ncbi:AbrB/MazE/SpoVT family DNA-binding domain-containing protein [Leucobacter sp. 7(1)]|uniref:AbrB/MazE/SpoVT family DNA-binding domain-containing protein n=1 Tax=Leucobacter sp. 7(1) TaxID=1255613 RepID=UPI000B34CB64|nr:AbrB/MazE/SpoVT family DNA-binding domain-containing protein [Leucobacter sp. 7(1)]
MSPTIDRAGRLVVPKQFRDAMGLTPHTPLSFDIVAGKLVIEIIPHDHAVEIEDGLPIIRSERDPKAPPLTDELVRELLEEARDDGIATLL